MWKLIGVFGGAAAWACLLISWQAFPDPDAFYHAKVAWLLWQHGPLQSFPWLGLTSLGTSFADHHFFFHVLEAPFVALLGWAEGARVTALVLAAAFLATCYACLTRLQVRAAWAWALLLGLTQPLMFRLLLGKATPVALLLFVLGLTAAWKRKPWIVLGAGFVFALSHGGWVFLVGSLGLLSFGELLHRYLVDGEPWPKACLSSAWRETLAALSGAMLGTLLHPNFPENLAFLWIQIVKIGLGTPYAHVILGNEWRPVDVFALLANLAPWVMALIAGLMGLALAPHKPLERSAARAATAFAWPVAACLALTLKSRRNVEYLVPALALWLPWLWMMIDVRQLQAQLRQAFSPILGRALSILLPLGLVCLLGQDALQARQALQRNTYPDAVYREAMQPVSQRAQAGDRVFHSDWDEFPMLFNLDDRLTYIAGLDPTFLYEASSTLSNAYRDLTWGLTSSTPAQAWQLISERLGSRFVFIDTRDHALLLEIIRHDPRYELLAETREAATFEVKRP